MRPADARPPAEPPPGWPRAPRAGAEILDEFRESNFQREWDALERHLHEAEAERHGWEPESVEQPDGRITWPLTTLPAEALQEGIEFYFQHLHALYGTQGDPAGWSYWAARDMRERHDVWRRRALATGSPTGPDAGEEVEA